MLYPNIEGLIDSIDINPSIVHGFLKVQLQFLQWYLWLFEALIKTHTYALSIFFCTLPLSFFLFFLSRYLPRRFLLHEPALALEQLNRHH
jgi:hypothetical protein